jgi:hypothetical protein
MSELEASTLPRSLRKQSHSREARASGARCFLVHKHKSFKASYEFFSNLS